MDIKGSKSINKWCHWMFRVIWPGASLSTHYLCSIVSRMTSCLHHHVRTPPWPTPAPPPYGQDAGSAFGAQGSPLAFHCPSIQITAIGAPNGNNDGGGGGGGSGGGHPQLGAQGRAWPRDQLYLPMDPCYRDSTFCPSPCSSLSSRSWMSDVSSCDSFSHAVNEDVDGDLRDAALRLAMGSPGGGGGGVGGGAAFGVELWQQKYQNPQNPAFSPALSPYQSPQHSPRASVTEDTWMNRCPSSRPRSRPTSPCGKRRHANADAFSRSPSPQRSASVASGASPLGSATDDAWPGPCGHSQHELDVPSKTRRTSGTQQVGDSPLEEVRGGGAPPAGEESHDSGGLAELFLQVPAHFSWTASKLGAAPLFRASSPPPLDFPLPSVFGPNRLSVEAEPRPYHRAHYETEGSRGAIKASDGGHPRVKVFCGLLRAAERSVLARPRQPAAVYGHGRRAAGRPPARLLPSPPRDGQDGEHGLPGEDAGRDQSPGDPPDARQGHDGHHGLRGNPQAAQRRHRAEERRDGRGPQEHACSRGLPGGAAALGRLDAVAADGLASHRVLAALGSGPPWRARVCARQLPAGRRTATRHPGIQLVVSLQGGLRGKKSRWACPLGDGRHACA
ncbi:nuclear factor of activated T-cells, cytoplasmic 3-like isoform X4 [Vanacampus margaritifer]